VAHRGVLIHVDRRLDVGVFGPSIDTLVMAEILAQQIFENGLAYETALEVGSGNGLLTALLALRGASDLKELFSIDMSAAATACTIRNFSTNIGGTNPPYLTYFMTGYFDPTLFNREFDLIVCNPPYIPLPNEMRPTTSTVVDFAHAVGGLDLGISLIKNSPRMLKRTGRMLLMASSLCLQDFEEAVPQGAAASRPLGPDGFEVIFDVEAVFNRPYWLKYLIEECGLTKRGDTYYHSLHPIWIDADGRLF
jgi:methylase of polypeptide subunit release factors